MSVIKCKMCGGDLELIESSSVAVCEYCGSQQTVPAADNEKKLTLFARANRLRLACEFDKAAGVYESIVADFPTEAEAYWGLVLCRYGIEYVDDPATGKKIPTCHRSSFDSVMEDSDFEQALENADAVARRVYRDEAKAIEELRRGIVEVSGKEPPYDIFICYKETAEDGQRTVDSVIAQDVYDALTEKGYRVFFSRISLEDKLGAEYEPYIFAALHSAKIMLAFGTDYEYYNAVWVKNEWSRYLQLMTRDKSKHLIPCYKGIDAYDMPKEFAKLQAQDMGKVGAMQDLLRGVDKIMGKGAAAAPTAANTASNATVDSLLDRAWMFLEDSDYQKAHEYLERVLDIDPRNSRAYLGNVLAALRIPTLAAMDTKVVCLDSFKDFERAMRFASESERQELENVYDAAQKKYLIKCVHVMLKSELKRQQRRQRKEEEENRKREAQLEAAYRDTCERMSRATDEEAFKTCAEAFAKIQGYRDAEECARKAEELAKEVAEERQRKEESQKREDQEKCRLLAQKRAAIAPYQKMIAAGAFTVGLKSNGTVVRVGDTHIAKMIAAGLEGLQGRDIYGDTKYNMAAWQNIVALAMNAWYAAGLKNDGTVVTTGITEHGRCDINSWRNIVAIAVSNSSTVGLKADGTVVAVGSNNYGQCNTSDWRDIVAVAASRYHTVGLKSDGTVAAIGDNAAGQCNVSDWRNIVAIAVSMKSTVGLRADGTVVAVGDSIYGQCNVSDWRDIVAIAANVWHTIGLKADGTVVATRDYKEGQGNVSDWTDIVAVTVGDNHTVGLRADGTVVAVGDNDNGRCNVGNWKLFSTKEELVAEKETLTAELTNLKGLFSGMRRKEIESRLVEIEKELNTLGE